MVLNEIYRKDAPYVASYNYKDLITNTGYVVFYGAAMVTSTPTYTKHLITEIVNCGTDENYGYTSTNGTYTFDSKEFDKTRIINGIPYASVPAFIWDVSSSGSTEAVVITSVKLIQIHVGGATTDLTNDVNLGTIASANPATGIIIDAGAMVIWNKISNISIKEGEKLRLSITIACTTRGAIGHNPAQKTITIIGGTGTVTTTNTQLTVHVPFKIPV